MRRFSVGKVGGGGGLLTADWAMLVRMAVASSFLWRQDGFGCVDDVVC